MRMIPYTKSVHAKMLVPGSLRQGFDKPSSTSVTNIKKRVKCGSFFGDKVEVTPAIISENHHHRYREVLQYDN